MIDFLHLPQKKYNMKSTGWIISHKKSTSKLTNIYEFKNFVHAFSFLTQVAFLSEKLKHHPTITNTYNKVTLQLSTHDEGDVVTEKDLKLKAEIDKIKID